MIVGAVIGGQPDYRCRATTGVLINDTLPGAADNGSFVKCEMHVGNNKTEQCTDWEYFGDVGHTIVSQVKDCKNSTIAEVAAQSILHNSNFSCLLLGT